MYEDGVSPADGLTKHDERKYDAIDLSFAEFGNEMPCLEDAWFILAVVRTSEVTKNKGGLPRVVGHILESFVFGPSCGVDFARTGVMLPLSSPFLLYADIGCLIADLVAIKELIGWKGNSGLRCCLSCSDVILAKYFRASGAPAS